MTAAGEGASSTLTHLEGALSGERYPADDLMGLDPADGRPLLARYDLEKAAGTLTAESLARRRTGGLWRWAELLPVRDPNHVVYLGEGGTPLLAQRQARRGARRTASRHQSRGSEPNGLVQGAGDGRRRLAGRGARRHLVHRAFGRERRRCARGLRCGRRRRGHRPHARGRDAGQPAGSARDGGASGAGPGFDLRLRQDRDRPSGQDRRIRREHAQGTLPRRGQEDHGLRARRTTRLAPSRRDRLPDRRGHRPRRHVEGLRRTGSAWPDRSPPAPYGERAIRGLRAHRESFRERRPFRRTVARTPRPGPLASGSPRPWGIS